MAEANKNKQKTSTSSKENLSQKSPATSSKLTHSQGTGDMPEWEKELQEELQVQLVNAF